MAASPIASEALSSNSAKLRPISPSSCNATARLVVARRNDRSCSRRQRSTARSNSGRPSGSPLVWRATPSVIAHISFWIATERAFYVIDAGNNRVLRFTLPTLGR